MASLLAGASSFRRHHARSPQTGSVRRLTRPCRRLPLARTYFVIASQAAWILPALRSAAILVPQTLPGPRLITNEMIAACRYSGIVVKAGTHLITGAA